jgi:hypothetical protein
MSDNKAAPLRELVWNAPEGHYGLCDRLRGLACGLALARARKLRLCFWWPANQPCPAEFGELFDQPAFACVTNTVREPSDDAAVLQLPANIVPEVFCKRLEESGFGSRPFSDDAMFQQAWRQEVCALRPVDDVMAAVSACFRACGSHPLIGIHLRRSDVVNARVKPEITSSNLSNHDRVMWDEVQLLAGQHPSACFFLAADEHAAFTHWAARLQKAGIPFIHHPKPWTNRFRQTSMHDALVDLWMLGRCQQILGTVRSGFLRIASALGAEGRLLKVETA